MNHDPNPALAEAIRRALIEAAEAAYEDAGIRGLCAEGRWEVAVQAMRAVDLAAVANGAAGSSSSAESPRWTGASGSSESAASG